MSDTKVAPRKPWSTADTRLFHRLQNQATQKIRLANTYFDDGALAAAAKLLREAADTIEQADAIKAKALASL